jgi:hypothetical protein
MSLSLWRGDQLLGTLRKRASSPLEQRPRPGQPPSLSAVLIPAVEASALSGVWQVHIEIGTFSAVEQFPVEPDIVAERYRHVATQQSNSGPLKLQPMSRAEAAGVPREVHLTVRDADGTAFLPRQISLSEVRYEPALYEVALREVPSEALVNGSVWCVFVSFASELEAPAT